MLLNIVQSRLCLSNASKLADYSACKQMNLSHEDVICVVDLLNFAKILSSPPTFQRSSSLCAGKISFTWTNAMTRSYDLLHPSTVTWRSSDCRQLHFEPGSARLLSSPSITIVWSNYHNYIHNLLWSLTSLKVTSLPKMFSNWDHNFQLLLSFTSTDLIGRCMT